MDLIEFREEGYYVVVAIDYFTRRLWARPLTSKSASAVVEFIKDLCKQGKKPEEIVTDNGKEFQNDQFRSLCRILDINHRKTSIESHKSNGRVERIIRTLRESILKSIKSSFIEKLAEGIEKYNKSYHAGVGCTPLEAEKDNSGKTMINNGPEGKYSKRFKKWYREKFVRNQRVKVAKSENLNGCSKYSKGRFLEEGVIEFVCPEDSYVVKLTNGRLIKKRHYDLKSWKD